MACLPINRKQTKDNTNNDELLSKVERLTALSKHRSSSHNSRLNGRSNIFNCAVCRLLIPAQIIALDCWGGTAFETFEEASASAGPRDGERVS